MKNLLIGIDIGGTTVKIGLITNSGEILEKWEIPTNTSEGGKEIIGDIWESIETKLDIMGIHKSSVLGIGVGAPGFIDADSGFVSEAVNLGWKNVQLAELLKNKSGLDVFAENDANVAVLGENWTGGGNGALNMMAITLGTGVGGGIIANGNILNGSSGMAGELGHIVIEEGGHQCNCGNKGCLETIASATGIVRQAMELIPQFPDSRLAARFNSTETISAKDVFELAAGNDEASVKIVKHTADVLGKVIANMGVIINPSVVLIGGGVSKAGDLLISEIRVAFERHALPKVIDTCEIRSAQLGNDAGIIGAAYLVTKKMSGVKI